MCWHGWYWLLVSVFVPLARGLTANNGDDVGTFWHFTDIHVDTTYTIENTSGYWGQYTRDTSPLVTFTGIEKGNDEGFAENNPDFVIFGGDSAPHNTALTEEKVIESLNFIAFHLKQAFPSDSVSVLPVIGNHDLFPANNMPIDPSSGELSNWCSMLADRPTLWKPWVDMASYSVFKEKDLPIVDFREGCYQPLVINNNPKLLLLGLNSILWYTGNPLANETVKDPLNQFLWIEKSLQWARTNEAKAILVTHVPPGVPELQPGEYRYLLPSYNDRLIDIMRRYSDVITTMIASHTHLDSFRVILDESNRPINTILFGPSMDPKFIDGVGDLNPRIRQYQYSRRTGQILDYRQFRLDISKRHPSWELDYVARATYKLKDLSAQSLADLLDTFTAKDDGDGLWDVYWRNELGGRPHAKLSILTPEGTCPEADTVCRCEHVCALRHQDSKPLSDCMHICHSSNRPKLPTIYELTHPVASSSTGLIAGVVIGVLCILILGGLVAYFVYRKRRQG